MSKLDTAMRGDCAGRIAQRIMNLLAQGALEAKVALEIQDMEELPSICSSKRDIGQLFFALAENAIQAADGKKNRRLVISGAEKGSTFFVTLPIRSDTKT